MEHQPILCLCHPRHRLRDDAQRYVIACDSGPQRPYQLICWTGYDEGGFSASISLPSFQKDYNLVKSHWTDNASGLANRKANISSFMVLGAAFGALSGLNLNDRLGRMKSFRLGIIVWAIGTFIQIFSSGIYGLLLFARIFAGLGAGLLTVTSPMYLSEVAPKATRGLAVGLCMVTLLAILATGE